MILVSALGINEKRNKDALMGLLLHLSKINAKSFEKVVLLTTLGTIKLEPSFLNVFLKALNLRERDVLYLPNLDENDIEACSKKVESFFLENERMFKEKDVLINITLGTKALVVGLVLGILKARRKINLGRILLAYVGGEIRDKQTGNVKDVVETKLYLHEIKDV